MPLGTFLNGGSVSQLRGLAWTALTDVGHIGTRTIVSDGGGGGTATWGYGSAIPCRVDWLKSHEGVVGERIDDRSTHLITAPPNTPVESASRFLVDGVDTFEVTALRTETDEFLRVFEAFIVS